MGPSVHYVISTYRAGVRFWPVRDGAATDEPAVKRVDSDKQDSWSLTARPRGQQLFRAMRPPAGTSTKQPEGSRHDVYARRNLQIDEPGQMTPRQNG
jgi:hypothetical protein